MKAQEASELGQHVGGFVQTGQPGKAWALLEPILAERTPFAMLGRIGEAVGAGPLDQVNAFLEQIAAARTEGGWVVIGMALGRQLDRDPTGAFARCRYYVVAADVWYGPDILGERVPGPHLLTHFEPALTLLDPWREDPNHWVRRTVGVAAHFWAKRSRGAPDKAPQAETLLAFLSPMFEERCMDAVKGVGWGLKTLGKHYPDLVTDWLSKQIIHHQRKPRALMLRKAMTYLSEGQRSQVIGDRPA